MAYIRSIGGVFTQHINKENENIAKRTSNINLEKIVQQNQLFLIQFKRSNRKKTFSDAMRNHKSAGGAISRHLFFKNVRGKEKQYSETHC